VIVFLFLILGYYQILLVAVIIYVKGCVPLLHAEFATEAQLPQAEERPSPAEPVLFT
jgi:hypothetical protein